MDVGVEWIVDATGCDAAALRDLPRVVEVLSRIIEERELSVVGQGLTHVFGGAGGVTALYLLRESHLACHTYPEEGIATFNLYCCRPRADWGWEAALVAALHAKSVTVRKVTRGAAAP
jgi:S-adenosylmethionine decarboxylase